MSKMTKQDVIRLVEEEDVEFIRLQFTGLTGGLRNIAITASQLEKALDNEFCFDGSAIEGFVSVERSDLYLHPDLDTFAIFPWRPQQGKVARLLCDIYYPDGTPFEGDPRYILKKARAKAAEMGYTLEVAPECEFFLFNCDEEGLPTTIVHEKAGFMDIAPLDTAENVRRDIILNLEDMGMEVTASHHESAPAQHEIDLENGEALEVADNLMTFRMAAKTIARRHGFHATFMPKPTSGVDGSGMHVNLCLIDRDGKNAFADESDPYNMSDTAYRFIAGIIRHASGMAAFTNPLVNSYKRLIPGYQAPVYITWSCNNRSPLIRVPGNRRKNMRLELRNPDGSANPYLMFALLLRAGLEGITEHLEHPTETDDNLFNLTEDELEKRGIRHLPTNLGEAITEMKSDPLVKEVLGDYAYGKYLEAKKREWSEYSVMITKWELDNYLNRF